MTDNTNLLQRVREAAGAAAAAVEELRDKIADLQDEARELDAKPCSRAEAEERLRMATASYGEGAGRALMPLLAAAPQYPAFPVSEAATALRGLSATDLLAALNPDALTAWGMRELDRRAALLGGWSPFDKPDRDGKRADLDNQVLALERQEEALIVEAEAVGVTIRRRPDANPIAVLGLDLDQGAAPATNPPPANRWVTAPPAMGRRMVGKAAPAHAGAVADGDDE